MRTDVSSVHNVLPEYISESWPDVLYGRGPVLFSRHVLPDFCFPPKPVQNGVCYQKIWINEVIKTIRISKVVRKSSLTYSKLHDLLFKTTFDNNINTQT